MFGETSLFMSWRHVTFFFFLIGSCNAPKCVYLECIKMCYKKYPTSSKKLFKEVLHENINPDRGKTGLIRSGIEVKLACVSFILYNLRRYWHKCYCGVAFSCIINRLLVMKDHYKYVKWVICIDMWIDYYSKHEGTIKSISRYNKYTLLILFYSCFVCLLRVFLPLNNFLLIWTRQRWRAANLDLCWALMAIEQIRFFCVSHLLRYGKSV